jgi:hypothetical protein
MTKLCPNLLSNNRVGQSKDYREMHTDVFNLFYSLGSFVVNSL